MTVNDIVDISVIVAVGREDVSRCLDSLLAQTCPGTRYEIILVTHSHTHTPASENVHVVTVDDPNPSLKRNTGARAANGEILAFIDDDAWAREDWLANGFRFLKERPEATGVGGPRLLPPDSSFTEKATDIIANSKFFGNGHGNWREMEVKNKVPHGMINACNYFIRKRPFLELGGYNEAIGYGGEDTEFVYRAVEQADCLFAYTWDLIVYHPPRRFGWGLIKQRFTYRFQNGRMLWVHPGLYLRHWTFTTGLFGITAFLAVSLFAPIVFPLGLAAYFLCAIGVSLNYARYDARFVLLLPPAFFVHHTLYYLAIWAGFLRGPFNRARLRQVRDFPDPAEPRNDDPVAQHGKQPAGSPEGPKRAPWI